MHKTKQGALKAARGALGAEAIEGVDFNLHQTGAGWVYDTIPPANEGAAEAQAERLEPTVPVILKGGTPGAVVQLTLSSVEEAGLIKVKDAAGNEVWTDPDNPHLVDGVLYPNKTRAPEARRLAKERAEAAAAPAPAAALREVAKKSVKAKRGARKEAAKAKVPKPAAPEGQTKTEVIVERLSTAGGATSKELETLTGWASHSIRGFLGTLRKRGVNVISKKLRGEPTIYRIPKGAPQKGADPVGDVV